MSETSAHTHHGIDYIELTVTDMDAARSFYRSAFGWEFNDYGPEYTGIRRFDGSEGEAGGLAAGSEVHTGGPLVLLYSNDLDTSLRAVGAAGGTVTEGPFDFPGGRRFHFTDPSGNQLGVWSEA
ncbi:VOC family protein [Nocardia flavorosea]|uniref:VOC family protein n=1 Tax=Nocardia flavorosea TaxID=53429 RepID=A0A846YBX6_9NOCA|nr:VOC family protein [Nocardia flavorosea]NKY56347.1 VOC family protein [Nocardia flavorosea]